MDNNANEFKGLRREKPNFTKLLGEVPHKPGVYIMRDRFGKVIYVGKAKDLRKRLASYFNASSRRRADPKVRSLIESIWDFDIHVVRGETESLLLESKMIKDYKPRYNILLRDDKRFIMGKIKTLDPFPKIENVRIRKNDGARYFGPYTNSVALRSTIDWLVSYLGLRTCAPLIPTENDYKHCHEDVIKNCSAPCIKKISQKQYMKLVEKAVDILDGKRSESKEIINMMEIQMNQASENLNFELASKIRDTIESFKFLQAPNRKFTHYNASKIKDFDEALREVKLLKDSLKLSKEPLVMECFDISNISDTHIVASMVRFTNGLPDNKNYRRYRIKTVKGQDDFASMEEVVRRRYFRIISNIKENKDIKDDFRDSQLTLSEFLESVKEKKYLQDVLMMPDLIIVDGGKGQLSSAVKALRNLGIFEQSIIGIAKKREEIFFPDRSDALRLSMNSSELKLLQRIRDEAHRYANGYHQLLMKRRISESVLDDCPGISEKKKMMLLKHFGSVARLRKSSIEDISCLDGFSNKSASIILEFLK